MGIDAWERFRARVTANDRRAQYVRNWTLILPLLTIPADEAIAQVRDHVLGLAEPAFERWCETLAVVANTLRQRAGLVGLADDESYERRRATYVAGGTPEAAQFAAFFALRAELDAVRRPVAVQPLHEDELALGETARVLGERMLLAASQAAPGAATPAALSCLVGLIGEYRALLDATSPEVRTRHMLVEGLEAALEAAGRCAFLLLRYDEAELWYERAADLYASHGAGADALRCRNRARTIGNERSGDVDAVVREHLAALLADEADGRRSTLDGARDVVALLEQAVRAGDSFEAAQRLGQAVALLEQAGYADPFAGGFDEAFTSWLDAISPELDGADVAAELGNVAELYAAIASALASLAQPDGAATGRRVAALLERLRGLASRMLTEAMAADAALECAWVAMSDRPLGLDADIAARLAARQAEAEAAQERVAALACEINAVFDELPEGDAHDARGVIDTLLERSERAAREAEALAQPASAALVALLRADLFLAAGKPREALRIVEAARAIRQHGGDGDASDRATDVRFLSRMVRAHAALDDDAAVSRLAGEAIAVIERDRYRVSSPYLQSAFLKDRAHLYALGTAAAYRLGDYETMLERIELTKARAAFRLRSLPEPPAPEPSDLEERFRAVCAQLAGGATPELLARRRNLWDLLAIARMRAQRPTATEMPVFSLAALRATLAPDEAIVSYAWIARDVLLVTAIDDRSTTVERVRLSEPLRVRLDELIEGLAALTHENEHLEPALHAFAATLLPPAIMRGIAGKKRLLISPHRELHLVPFHALPWNGGYLIEAFAVSYAPSLSMLLAPVPPARAANVLLAGVSDFTSVARGALPALTGIDEELRDVASAYRARDIPCAVVKNGGVTREALLRASDDGELARYTCIMFATHGTSVFAADALDAPMESRVYLNDVALDGLEISRLRLAADLVVLSACCSGQRAIAGRGMAALAGDDLFGLQAALNMAGAANVLGCLWPAHDRATPPIMTRFHRELAAGMPADEALQAALVEALRNTARTDVFYWAPFFLSSMGRRAGAASVAARPEEQAVG